MINYNSNKSCNIHQQKTLTLNSLNVVKLCSWVGGALPIHLFGLFWCKVHHLHRIRESYDSMMPIADHTSQGVAVQLAKNQ